VQQDVVMFPGTVRDNLALRGGVSDAALHDAIALAQASGLVERLGGLDGAISAGGRNLSVGEAQLLAFARTLAHDAPFVVLDEATASVDSLTEARIQDATRALFERKTVLVVAHRLSTITGADRICVLDAGRVVEEGRHEELLSRGGAYARLFYAQLSEERRERAAGE
jgi:ABC-type multidrug transport system fused ATPase/permease subunit